MWNRTWHFIGYFSIYCNGQVSWEIKWNVRPLTSLHWIFQAYLAIAEMWRAWHFIGYFNLPGHCRDVKGLTFHWIFQLTYPLQRCEGPDISLDISSYLVIAEMWRAWHFIWYFNLPGHCRDVKGLTFHWIFQLTWPLQRCERTWHFIVIFQLTWPLQRCEGPDISLDISTYLAIAEMWRTWHFIGYFNLPGHCRDVKGLDISLDISVYLAIAEMWRTWHFIVIFQFTWPLQRCEGPDISLDISVYLAIAEMWRTWHFMWIFQFIWPLQRCEGPDISLDISTYLAIAEMWRAWHFIGYFSLPGHCRDVKVLDISFDISTYLAIAEMWRAWHFIGYFNLPGHCRDVKGLTFHVIFQFTWPLQRCEGPDISLDISNYLAIAEMWRTWHFIGYFSLPGHCRDVKGLTFHWIFQLTWPLQRCEGPDISLDISTYLAIAEMWRAWHFIGYFSLPIHCRDVKDLTFHWIFQVTWSLQRCEGPDISLDISTYLAIAEMWRAWHFIGYFSLPGHCRDVKGLAFHLIFQLTWPLQRCEGPDISFDISAYLATAEMWRTWHFIGYFNLPGHCRDVKDMTFHWIFQLTWPLQRCEGHDISLDISTYLAIAEMWRAWHFIGYFNLPGHCRDVKDLTFHWIFQLTWPLQRCEGPSISLDISVYLAIAEMWRTWHFIGYFSLPGHCRDVKDLTFHWIFQFTWPLQRCEGPDISCDISIYLAIAEMWRAWHFIGYFNLPGHCRDVKGLTFHVIFQFIWPLQRCEGPDISLDISTYLAIAEMWRTWHFIGYFNLPGHCRDVKDMTFHWIFQLTYPLQRCEGPDISLDISTYLAIAEMWRTWHFIGYFSLPGHCRDVKGLTFHVIFQLTWPLQRCEGPDISLDISTYLSIAEMWRTWHFIGYFSLPGHCRDVKDMTFHWIFQFTWPLQRCEGPDISLDISAYLSTAEMWRTWHFIGYFSLPGHCRDVKGLTFHWIFQLTWPLQRYEGPDISFDISVYLATAEMWRAWHFIWYFSLPGHCRDVKGLTFHLIFQLTWPLQRCEGPDISLDISAYLAIAEMWRAWHFMWYFNLSGHCRDVNGLTFHWIFQLTWPLQRCEGPDISLDISTYLAIAEMWRAWHFIGYFNLPGHCRDVKGLTFHWIFQFTWPLQRCEGPDISLDISTYLAIAEMWRAWHFIGYFNLPGHCRDVKGLTFHWIFQFTWPLQRCEGPDISLDISTYLAIAEMWRAWHFIGYFSLPGHCRDVKGLTFHVIFQFTWPLQRCEGHDISLDISTYLAIAEMWRAWHFIGYFNLPGHCRDVKGLTFHWIFQLTWSGPCRDVKGLTFHWIFQLTWPLQRCEGPDISLDISTYLAIAEMWRAWHFIGYFNLPGHCRDVKGLTFHWIFQLTWPLQRCEGPDISLDISTYLAIAEMWRAWHFIGYFNLPGHCRDVKGLTFHWIFQLTWPLQRCEGPDISCDISTYIWPLQRCEGPDISCDISIYLAIAEMWRTWHFIGYFNSSEFHFSYCLHAVV